MLTKLELHHFKAHTETRFPLARLSVVAGPNASGKSSVIEALYYLARASSRPLTEVFAGSTTRWLVRPDAPEMQILARVALGGTSMEVALTMPSDGDLRETTCEWSAPSGGVPHSASKYLQDWLRSTALLRLDPKRLAEPSFSDDEQPRLHDDGYGLPTVLSALKLSWTDRFQQLEDAARRIVPSLRRIGFKRTKIEQHAPRAVTIEGQRVQLQDKQAVVGDELLLDFVDVTELPAHAASEGTLLALGLLSAVYSPTSPRLLLVDDLERALHPKAQRELVVGLRAALTAVPEAQIVAATSSPHVAEASRPDEVVVLARDRRGAVAPKRLCEPPGPSLLDALTTGEEWMTQG